MQQVETSLDARLRFFQSQRRRAPLDERLGRLTLGDRVTLDSVRCVGIDTRDHTPARTFYVRGKIFASHCGLPGLTNEGSKKWDQPAGPRDGMRKDEPALWG